MFILKLPLVWSVCWCHVFTSVKLYFSYSLSGCEPTIKPVVVALFIGPEFSRNSRPFSYEISESAGFKLLLQVRRNLNFIWSETRGVKLLELQLRRETLLVALGMKCRVSIDHSVNSCHMQPNTESRGRFVGVS